jgi:hypothetical protein
MAPTNDQFANARYIWNGVGFGDDTVGSTLETGEATTTPGWQFTIIGTGSVWYRWIADFTGPVQFAISDTNGNHILDIFQGNPDLVTDTLYTVTRLGTVVSAKSWNLTVNEGVSYYLRVAVSGAGTTNFGVTFPIGRAPNALSSSGTNDLPVLGRTVRAGALVEMTEAIGVAPDSEKVVSSISLVAGDYHSTDTPATLIKRNSDGSPAFTCERWIRLRISPPFGAIANLRFWINNYAPNAGWQLYWGISNVYQKPNLNASRVAISPVPTVDPVTGNLGMGFLTGGQVQYSPWIVLQARWLGSSPGPIQSTPLNYRFDWSES